MSRIREDLQLSEHHINDDGNKIFNIHDPIAETNFKVCEKIHGIIKYFSISKDIPELTEILKTKNIPGSQQDIERAINFLDLNNLLVNNKEKAQKKSVVSKLVSSYFYIKFPLAYPNQFLDDSWPVIRLFINRITVTILTFISLVGFALLYKHHESFISGISQSFTVSSIKYYLFSLLGIKVIHELSHAYTAKYYGTKVRSMGIAFIFMCPRLYCDTSDMLELPKRQRVYIALAGIWSEIIIAGLASFVFLNTELYSVTSSVSVSIIIISLVSSLFFNANPFMRFDGYHVFKNMVGYDNLYERSANTLKEFWRKIIFGIKPDSLFSKGELVYGQLCFIYKLFLYSTIVILVYNFTFKILGILLAVIEVYAFFIKPLIREVKFLYIKRSAIPAFNRILTFCLFSSFVGLAFYPILIPKFYPSIITTNNEFIRADVEGQVVEISSDEIILKNLELEYSVSSLRNNLKSLEIQKNFMLLNKDYSSYEIVKEQVERTKELLKQEEIEYSKLTIPIPPNFKLIEDELVGQYIRKGYPLIRSHSKFVLNVISPVSDNEIQNGYFFNKNSLKGLKISTPNSCVKLDYIPPILSTTHNGLIETDNRYKPLQPKQVFEFILDDESHKNTLTTGTTIILKEVIVVEEIYDFILNFINSEYI